MLFWAVLISVLLSAFIWSATKEIFAFDKGEAISVTVTVPEGAGLPDVAKIYKKAGLIKYPLVYELYSKLRGDDGKYLSG